jgi:hypothetical protein
MKKSLTRAAGRGLLRFPVAAVAPPCAMRGKAARAATLLSGRKKPLMHRLEIPSTQAYKDLRDAIRLQLPSRVRVLRQPDQY